MSNLNLGLFIIPGIISILLIALYWLLSKRVANKTAFKRLTFIVIAVAFMLNFAWEVIQMPLYKDADFNVAQILFCALASVADVLMVLLLYYAFALIYKNPFWVQNLTIQRTLILALIGGAGAVLAEIKHVSLGNWTYSNSMPIIPIVNVGLSPVLQFMILPVIIYYLSFYFTNKKYKNKTRLIKT